MLKGMPKVSNQCIMAIIEKAGQRPPSEFAGEFLEHLIKSDQKPALTALMAIQEKFSQGDEEVGLKIIASVGIFWKQIETMIEAAELENLFAEGEANV
tara:strand:+ start:513 stop:806 length:294 start_codon:yes stop_codon:yes gene_type:complete